MNKVLLIFSFICITSRISSISPPKFPVTFYTNVKTVEQFANVTQHPIIGSIANDDAKQLYVHNGTISPNIPFMQLFNNNLYEYQGDSANCECFNVTYKYLPLPFFSRFKNFMKYSETDSEIIWKCTDTPPDDTLLFFVKKETPNVPELVTESIPSVSINITFTGFRASPPSSDFFRIPDDCTKVPCLNPPKKRSMFFSSFLVY